MPHTLTDRHHEYLVPNSTSPGPKTVNHASLPWWKLLFIYLRDADTMRRNPLLERVIRRQARPPQWRPEIRSLWFFPLMAVGLVIFAVTSMGQGGGMAAAVGIGFAAALCAYPPYLVGGSLTFLIPALVAPTLSSQVQARTLDVLRVTPLSSAEILLGKWLGALIPFSGLLNYMATFFILIVILGGLGASAIPVLLGFPPGETLGAVILLELPIIFGPIVNIIFIGALSLVISAHTSRPSASIIAAYSIILAYWVLTGLVLVVVLAFLSQTLVPDSALVQAYVTSPVAFLYPNVLRLALSTALAPILIQVTISRIERL